MREAIELSISGQWNPFDGLWADGHEKSTLFERITPKLRKACCKAVLNLSWSVCASLATHGIASA